MPWVDWDMRGVMRGKRVIVAAQLAWAVVLVLLSFALSSVLSSVERLRLFLRTTKPGLAPAGQLLSLLRQRK